MNKMFEIGNCFSKILIGKSFNEVFKEFVPLIPFIIIKIFETSFQPEIETCSCPHSGPEFFASLIGH